MSEMNKKIFSYFNGESQVFADPAAIDYKFIKASENQDMNVIDKWMFESKSEDGDTDEVTENKYKLFMEGCHRLDPIVRTTFDLKPFDDATGQGMIQEDVIKLYIDYIEWRADVKKNTGLPPTGA